MAWLTADEMTKEVGAALSDALRLAFVSCGTELQIDAIDKLADIDERLEAFRATARAEGNEENANRAYVLRHYLSGVANFLWMWLYIKYDQMAEAWDALINGQADVEFGLRFLHDDEMKEVATALYVLERVLFPPQQFVSPGHVYEYATCTICGGIYGDCGHVAGRLYMGEVCLQHPHDFRPDHLALVDHPEDRGCRWVAVQNGKHMVCTLTRRVVGDADENSELRKATMTLLRSTRMLGVARVRLVEKGENGSAEAGEPVSR